MSVSDYTGSGGLCHSQLAGAHCHHCGRLVRETTHTRLSYSVDGFALHTGETEEAMVRRSDSDEIALVYRRLVRPVVVHTCRDCYAELAVRRRHQSWAYPAD